MKLEEGKYYVTRSGERVRASYDNRGFMKLSNDRCVFTATGRANFDGRKDAEDDIISEWATETKDGPIREVRRREIVPGIYGILNVSNSEAYGLSVSVYVEYPTAEQLREAAHILNQLAEYLEGEK